MVTILEKKKKGRLCVPLTSTTAFVPPVRVCTQRTPCSFCPPLAGPTLGRWRAGLLRVVCARETPHFTVTVLAPPGACVETSDPVQLIKKHYGNVSGFEVSPLENGGDQRKVLSGHGGASVTGDKPLATTAGTARWREQAPGFGRGRVSKGGQPGSAGPGPAETARSLPAALGHVPCRGGVLLGEVGIERPRLRGVGPSRLRSLWSREGWALKGGAGPQGRGRGACLGGCSCLVSG